jgi:hypothetical protein
MAIAPPPESEDPVSLLRPGVPQERWLNVWSQLGLARESAGMEGRCGDWRTGSPLARCLFFVLGAMLAGLAAVLLYLLHLPAAGLLAGLIAAAVAEGLIVRARFFGSGLEEGLEVTGLLMIAADLAARLHDPSGSLAALLCAILLCVAGLRLLNPLLVATAALAFSMALFLAVRHSTAVSFAAAQTAAGFCGLVALIALMLGRVVYHRPAHDRMFDWLVIVMPITAYLWSDAREWWWFEMPAPLGAPWMRYTPLLLLAGFGACALLTGLHRRRHAPIVAFLGCVACLAYDLRKLSGLSLEFRLIAGGSLVLLLTLVLDRYLRTARGGITSARIAGRENDFDLLELAGAATLSPQALPGPKPEFQGGGGQGGGGGASGSY